MAEMNVEQFEIRNRWTNAVQLTAEITCAPDVAIRVKLGLAVRLADLSGAPTIPNIHQRVYEAASAPAALDMTTWHKCETTHCRAGWVVVLAGSEGQKLEEQIGTPAAATLIYLASDPTLERLPNFYADNASALADMKRLADLEAARAA